MSTKNPLHTSSHPRSPYIHNLPLETLAHIFSLLCRVKPSTCPARRVDLERPTRAAFSKGPIVLSHVCSYWRQIIVGQGSFWSHIHIFPDQVEHPVASKCLEVYVARSAQALLDVHVVIPYMETVDDDAASIFPFLSSIAPPTRSLTFQSFCELKTDFCGTALAAFFANCTPGTLSEVSISFLIDDDQDLAICTGPQAPGLSLTGSYIEDLWLPVTSLHFSLFRVGWDSKAYHGLTELRITTLFPPNYSEFSTILVSSPQLRILEIDGLDKDPPEEASPPTPIRLDNLEILILRRVLDCRLCSILQLITPGTRPLSLSILNPYENGSEFASKKALQCFVSRSNITRLCASGFKNYLQLTEVLDLIPTIRVLAVNESKWDFVDKEDVPPTAQKLDALYIINPRRFSAMLTWAIVESLVKHYTAVQKLTLWKNDFDYRKLGQGDKETIPDNLHTICPMVQLIPQTEPNPIEEWY